MMEKTIVIYGASGFGREVAWLTEVCSGQRYNYRLGCFIDDDVDKHGTQLNGIDVLSLQEAQRRFPDASVIGGIGNPKIRQKLMERVLRLGFSWHSVIHPSTELSQWIEIGDGAIICAGNILTANIALGPQVQINLGCTIGHDVVMGEYATLAPGVHVSGWVHIGRRVYIGTGAVIINGTSENPLRISDDVIIGAGACVTRSIPAGEKWVGVPARRLAEKLD